MSPSIVLCMIERNESRVLPRSLASFRALKDAGCSLAYGIVDGGSDDGSVEVIEEAMAGVSGHVNVVPQPQPLDDFSAARNAAIQIARPLGDWMLMLDADDEIVLEPGFKMPELDSMDVDGYAILVRFGSQTFWRPALVKSSAPWHYEGEIHEHIECKGGRPVPKLGGIEILVHPGEGSRSSDPKQKFLNDASVLEKVLERTPNDPRTLFYYAQSLRDAGELEKSLKIYQKRAMQLWAWDEETYCATLEVARIKAALEFPVYEVMDAYLQAHNFRPWRREALGFLAEYLRLKSIFHSSVYFANQAMQIPYPKNDVLFVSGDWYDWRAEDEFSISCFYLGDPMSSKRACDNLLASGKLPEAHRVRVENNLAFAEAAIREFQERTDREKATV
jgi:glycosyltransferase involved in cell wall biosynthesis